MVDTEAPTGQFSVAGSFVFAWRPTKKTPKHQNVLFQPNYLRSQACLENVVCLECLRALDREWLLEALSGQLSFA